jgi:hypothetical protein
MSRFANLATKPANVSAPPTVAAGIEDRSPVAGVAPPSRIGRKAITGYFSPDLSMSLHILARKQGKSLQALMGEAFDDLLRKYGEHPVGDR